MSFILNKSLMEAINKAKDTIIIDSKKWSAKNNYDTPLGEGSWLFSKKGHVNLGKDIINEDYCILNGLYEEVSKQAKEWGKTVQIDTVYLLDKQLNESLYKDIKIIL